MNARMKALLGVSAFALLSGAAPVVPAMLTPISGTLGMDASLIASDAEAQESGEGEGEGSTECTTETGEGEEGGSADCAPPEGEGGEGEGEGEGEG